MSIQTMVIGTCLLLLGTNLIGFIYSLLVLKTDLFKKYRIQSKPYQKGILGKRLPLYFLNLFVLLIFTGGGIYSLSLLGLIESTIPSLWVVLLQVLVVFFIDDLWFYIAHKWLHENKWALKTIHSIHHRAFTPFPLEYLYVHPAEWMIGIIGTFLGYAILLAFMPLNIYAIWIFGFLRNLHEIHIHSDLKIPIMKDIPLVSPVEDHDLHHAKLNGNYASTFRIWDRVFKTRFKDAENIN